MLPSLDEYAHAQNLRDRLIPSRDIDDQRILQSDWLRSFQATTEEPSFFQTCGFHRIMKNTDVQKLYFGGIFGVSSKTY